MRYNYILMNNNARLSRLSRKKKKISSLADFMVMQ
jgi:hypothetical protein